MTKETDIRIIPPIIPAATMGLGAALYYVWPASVFGHAAIPATGWILIGLSFVPVALAIHALRRAETTADVRKRASALVTGGVYRFTRNPMYLAMMLLCLGLALAVNSLAMLVLVVPTGSLLCLAVIRKEEAGLHEQFGDTYATYARSVRRWL